MRFPLLRSPRALPVPELDSRNTNDNNSDNDQNEKQQQQQKKKTKKKLKGNDIYELFYGKKSNNCKI